MAIRFFSTESLSMNYFQNHPRTASVPPLLLCLIAVAMAVGALFGEDTTRTTGPESAAKGTPSEAAITDARARAKLLQNVYTTTLEVIHKHYFRREGAVLPARAMDDVFAAMSASTGDAANWISVNTKAMNIDHEPASAFEKEAAAQLAAGKDEYEVVGKRVYRRAVPIPLHSRCVGCHTKMFDEQPKSPRMAGLVISISLPASDSAGPTPSTPK